MNHHIYYTYGLYMNKKQNDSETGGTPSRCTGKGRYDKKYIKANTFINNMDSTGEQIFQSIMDMDENMVGNSRVIEDTTTTEVEPISVIYSNKYNYYPSQYIPLTFISNKLERIYNTLNLENKNMVHIKPEEEISQDDILGYHTPRYLTKLNGHYVSNVLGCPGVLSLAPQSYVDYSVLDPIRWQVSGTCLATKLAIQKGAAINIGGGYKHAKRASGSYGCIFSDIAIAIEKYCSGLKVAIINADSESADGLYEYTENNENVYLIDIFNKNISKKFYDKFVYMDLVSDIYEMDRVLDIMLDGGYLEQTIWGQDKLFNVNVSSFDFLKLTEKLNHRKICNHEYVRAFKKLGDFLDKVKPDIVFYNAGIGVHHKDPYGCMNVTQEGLVVRDLFIWYNVVSRKIPIVMTISENHVPDGHNIVGECLSEIINFYPKFVKGEKLEGYHKRLNHLL